MVTTLEPHQANLLPGSLQELDGDRSSRHTEYAVFHSGYARSLLCRTRSLVDIYGDPLHLAKA